MLCTDCKMSHYKLVEGLQKTTIVSNPMQSRNDIQSLSSAEKKNKRSFIRHKTDRKQAMMKGKLFVRREASDAVLCLICTRSTSQKYHITTGHAVLLCTRLPVITMDSATQSRTQFEVQ